MCSLRGPLVSQKVVRVTDEGSRSFYCNMDQ